MARNKKKGQKRNYAMGGRVAPGTDYFTDHPMFQAQISMAGGDLAEGGKIKGNSHKKGGVNVNVEGGEYVIKKDSVNAKTEPVLEAINRTGTVKKGSAFPIAKNKYKQGK